MTLTVYARITMTTSMDCSRYSSCELVMPTATTWQLTSSPALEDI